jgi:hypothetical protein
MRYCSLNTLFKAAHSFLNSSFFFLNSKFCPKYTRRTISSSTNSSGTPFQDTSFKHKIGFIRNSLHVMIRYQNTYVFFFFNLQFVEYLQRLLDRHRKRFVKQDKFGSVARHRAISVRRRSPRSKSPRFVRCVLSQIRNQTFHLATCSSFESLVSCKTLIYCLRYLVF